LEAGGAAIGEAGSLPPSAPTATPRPSSVIRSGLTGQRPLPSRC
jgi:hypothetical protein